MDLLLIVIIKMSTISGLIRQKYYNASISFIEIPPAGATANDGPTFCGPGRLLSALVPKIFSDSELKDPHGSIYYGFLSCHVP